MKNNVQTHRQRRKMSEALVKEWKDRVEEAETELRLVRHDIEVIHKSSEKINGKLEEHFQTVEAEKVLLLEQLDKTAKEAQILQKSCEEALTHKEIVEAEYQKALEDYEKLHFEVREIKDMEEDHLHSRIDYKKLLEKESALWAKEEHYLRQQLSTLQREYQQNEKRRKEEKIALEEELQRVEKELEDDRNYRIALLNSVE